MTYYGAISSHATPVQPQTAEMQEAGLPETGVAGKNVATATAAAASKTSKAMQALADKAIAAGPAAPLVDNKPVLAAPKDGGGIDVVGLLSDLIERLDDPAVAARAEQIVADLAKGLASAVATAKQGGFDINDMKSFAPVDLIMLLLHLLDKLRSNDAALNAKMTLSAAAAVNRTAASLEKQGHDQMTGAVTGAVLGAALTFASVGLKANSSRKNYLNENNNGKAIKDLNAETQKAKAALHAAKPGAPGAEAATLTGTAAGTPKSAAIAPSDKALSDAHRKNMEIKIEEGHAEKLAELDTARAKNNFIAAKWNMGGDVAGGLGVAAGNIATAAAHTQVMSERGAQTLSELNSNVAKQASSEAAERNQAQNGDTRTIRDIAQQILNAITQGRGGQINNLRV